MANCHIDLGQQEPCTLTVRVIPGMTWVSPNMTRASGEAWAAAPRLMFGTGQVWTAVLSQDGNTAVITAQAHQTEAIARGTSAVLRDDNQVYAIGYVETIGLPL